MIHPSYVELMKVVNNDVEIGEEPVLDRDRNCQESPPDYRRSRANG